MASLGAHLFERVSHTRGREPCFRRANLRNIVYTLQQLAAYGRIPAELAAVMLVPSP